MTKYSPLKTMPCVKRKWVKLAALHLPRATGFKVEEEQEETKEGWSKEKEEEEEKEKEEEEKEEEEKEKDKL